MPRLAADPKRLHAANPKAIRKRRRAVALRKNDSHVGRPIPKEVALERLRHNRKIGCGYPASGRNPRNSVDSVADLAIGKRFEFAMIFARIDLTWATDAFCR